MRKTSPIPVLRILAAALLLFVASASATPVPLNRIVAVVNDGVIVQTRLDQRIRRVRAQIRQKGIALPPGNVLRRKVLDRMVMEKIQLQLAARTGIQVDDNTLNHALRSIARRNNMTLNQFREALVRDGYSYDQFRRQVRDEITIGRLHQREVTDRITVTPQEVSGFLATMKKQADRDKEFHIVHILIAVPEAPTPEQIRKARAKAEAVLKRLRNGANFEQTAITVSDGQQALKGGDLGWRPAAQVPTLFADVVAKLKPGRISGLIRSPSGFHIIKLLGVRGEQTHIITQYLCRNILIHTDQLISDADARAQLEQLRARVEGGDSFAALARGHSQDPASAPNGGDMGWVAVNGVDPHFAQVLKSLQPGQVSAPFKTRRGWEIIRLIKRRKHDSTAEYRRAKAREILIKRKTEEALALWLRRLRDESYVDYRLKPTQG
ncbi:chaperone SurA precursor [bacterium BMS3Bbin12]|nr:chaperone SurA precursor [bacterium BMS3Abin12]GBE47354.1 chaperone SurA precursor [bacterium BMS3Bbin12]GBE50340.1 chaperone SurA precursor [bacterium BMS3Bbin13]HDJ86525.1 molecular chaperone SurA [Chromatiales bacterium]HDK03673.1 molecular chaperone SurA [Gammaproteobacteria bacterium]